MKYFVPAAAVLLLLPLTVLGEEVVLHAVGDIMLSGSAAPVLSAKGYGYPFDGTRQLLAQSDVLIGNLEAPISVSGREFTGKKFRFRVRTEAAVALKDAGFSVLTLANNHIMDFGPDALRETRRHLDSCGIAHCGAGNSLEEAQAPAIITVKRRRIAFLAYSWTQPIDFFAAPGKPGTAPAYGALVRGDISRARSAADLVVVSFHWGLEGKTIPRERERQMARAAIDAGADAVLGHHPHVLQGVEFHRGKPIFYSLGNYVFGSLSRVVRLGMIARIVFPVSGEPVVEVLPLNVWNPAVRFRPVPMRGAKAKIAAREIDRMCVPLGSHVEERGGRFLIVQGSR